MGEAEDSGLYPVVGGGLCTEGVCQVGQGQLKAPEQDDMTLKQAQEALIFYE